MRTLRLFASVALSALASVSLAQWPTDPAANLPLSTRAGEQAQPKLAPTTDGGVWVSWFDNADGGFDVYLQRLDANANPAFPANGMLIADRSFSSTQDYDLCTDGSGDAYLVFRDTPANDGVVQIVAHRVTPDGSQPWGVNGIQLTTGTGFKASPKCACATDGSSYFAWTTEEDWVLQRLTLAGSPTLGTGVVVDDPDDAVLLISDLQPTVDGDVIALWVRQPTGFLGPKRLRSMRYDLTGARVWGAADAVIFDTGSLQFGNFPTFVSDGMGGGVYAWYETSLECFVQRINPDGSERFAHNGIPVVAAGGSALRVSPDVAFDHATGETVVFWTDLNSSQSMSGVSGQRFSDAGARQWGLAGSVVVPLGSPSRNFVRAEVVDGDAVVSYFDQATPVSGTFVRAARLDASGTQVWAGSPINVSTDSGDKGRLQSARDTNGRIILAWSDDRAGNPDIYAQALNADGTLGGELADCPGDCDTSGAVDFGDLVAMLAQFGNPGGAGCDADGSGIVNFGDLVAALALFGPCD